MAPLINIHDVTVQYGNNVVLEHFNLTVHKGDFITIIGTSGCGKSTAMGLVNGMVKPTKGTVEIDGENIEETDLVSLRRHRIGYVIQDVGLFPHLNIYENVVFIAKLDKHPPEQAVLEQKVRTLFEMLALPEALLTRYPKELSGGQKQRVGIARAFMSSPDIILMDEPFGAVDEITRRHLQKELRILAKKLNATVLFITHDIREALLLGTRVVVMDKGKILQDAPPHVIQEQPATEFVRELVSLGEL